MQAYFQSFIAVGHGVFPVDMLRYDHCYPASQDAVSAMICERNERSVELARVTNGKPPDPTIARWESFGWRVVRSSIRAHKL